MERKRNWKTEEGMKGGREGGRGRGIWRETGEIDRGSGEEEELGDGGSDGRGGRGREGERERDRRRRETGEREWRGG